MQKECYLNVNLILALRDWKKALREGRFELDAQTGEEAILRAETLMRGLPNRRELAEGLVKGGNSLPSNPEALLRGRLLYEMNACLRRGGVILPDGRIEKDLPGVVERAVFELNPELKKEVDLEQEGIDRENNNPSIIEDSFNDIA